MALSPDHIFIPLPASEGHNNTPILKWVLSRPNTHLFPLHLLTTGRSLPLDVVNEEIVGCEEDASFDDEATAHFDEVSSRDDDGNPDGVSDESGEEQEKMEETPGQSPNNMPSTPLAYDFLQNPYDATSTMMETMDDGELRAPLPLPPVSSLFAPMPPLQRIQMLQQPTLLQPLLTEPLQQLQPQRQEQQEELHDLREEDVDVVGEWDGNWRDYTPVLPPSPVYEPLADAVVKEADDAIKIEDDDEKEQQISLTSSIQGPHFVSSRWSVHRPAAIAAVAAATAAASTHMKPADRLRRLALTPRQRDVFSGIMARVSYLWPAEREILAAAFGITQKQVLNVFMNRGGRAYHRQAVGMSMEEAQGIIREELIKFGFAPKDDDEKKKK